MPPKIYWQTSHETGDLSDWSKSATGDTAGGNFSDEENGDLLEVGVARTGDMTRNMYAAHCKIKRAIDRSIGTRLMRWRDWQGNLIPAEAYYSTWMYVPHNYLTTAGWWIVFQFKSQRRDNSTSDPTITGNLWSDGGDYVFYFWDHLKDRRYESTAKIKAGRWTHLEAKFRYDRTKGALNFWQDGKLVIERRGLCTKIRQSDLHQVWGIGNYTSGIDGHPDGAGIAEIYFDDAAICAKRKGVK